MSGVGPLMGDISWMALKSNGFVLELGSFTGEGSTRAISEGLNYYDDITFADPDTPSPLHITVDWEDNLKENRPPFGWWHMVVGDTRQWSTLEDVNRIAGGRKAGLIFIDTDHNYDQMSAELAIWQGMADDKTTWLFHDTHMYGVPNVEMVKAITEFAEANGWRYEDYRQDSHGLGRMRR